MSELSYIGKKQIGKLSILKFYVDNNYKIPEIFMRSDVSQMQIAFDFSARLLDLHNSLSDDYVKSTFYTNQMKLVEDEYNKQLIQIEKKSSEEFSGRLTGILDSITEKQKAFDSNMSSVRNEYENKIRDLTREMKKIEGDATAAKLDLESLLQKDIKVLKKQIAEKDTELQVLSRGEAIVREQCSIESEKLIKIIEEKNTQALDAIKKSYDHAIELKEEALKQRELKVSQREQELQTTIQRNASSIFRGQDGESYFSSLAESKMKWKLKDTRKIPRSCDYSGTIHKIPVFFEVKNYTSDVKQEEVTKFLRDMKEHPDVLIGIFISLNTRITGKDKEIPISIEWINDSQCGVYIQSFKELDEDHTLSLIDQLIKLSGTYNKLISSKGYLSEESVLQARIDKARVHIEEYITESCSLIKRVISDQKIFRQHVENSFCHTLSALKNQSACINTALEIITGEYKEDNVIDEPVVFTEELSASKPKKGSKKKV
jgi:hypothetical protein